LSRKICRLGRSGHRRNGGQSDYEFLHLNLQQQIAISADH
jgi:hypothetical protein